MTQFADDNKREFKHISRLQREYKKEGDVDDDYLEKFTLETTSWRAMLVYQFDICYIVIMIMQIYISNTLVTIDALFIYVRNTTAVNERSLDTLSTYIYILDYTYFVDILMKTAFNKFSSKNQKLRYASEPLEILILDFISMLPYEIAYENSVRLPKQNIVVYIRLRTLLRLVRFHKILVNLTKIKVLKSIVIYRAIIYILEFTRLLTLVHYYLYCTHPTKGTCIYRDWHKLSAMSHINLNSVISSGVYVQKYKVILLDHFRSFVNIVYKLYITYVVSVLTCIILEEKENVYEYVNEYSQICSTFKYLKQQYKQAWTYENESVYEVLKSYYSYLLRKRNGSLVNISAHSILPKSQMVSVLADVAYNALKHSHVFRHQDNHLLRFLSTLVRFDFAVPGQVIIRKGELNSNMIYISHGVLQVLSQEDNETSVLSLSGGSCIGESTLFMQYPSSCTIVCQTYCELVVLPLSNFRKVIKVYPNHYKYLRSCVIRWINQAIIMNDQRDGSNKAMTLAKIKDYQYHIWVNSIEQMMIMYQSELENFSFYVVHMDRIVVSDDIELIEDKVFIKTSFHFILQPNSPLLVFWEFIILVITIAFVLFFPLYCTFSVSTDLYEHFFIIIVTIIFGLDIYFQLFTAVKTRGATYITFRRIVVHRFSQPTFILDCLSFLPIEAMSIFTEGYIKPTIYPFLQANRLLKYYRVETFFRRLYTRSTTQMSIVEIVRYCFHICMFYYFTCIAMYRMNCTGRKCNIHYHNFLVKSNSTYMYSIFMTTFSLAQSMLGNTHYDDMPKITSSFHYVVYSILALGINVLNILFISNVIATSALKKLHILKDQENIINIFKSLQKVGLGYNETIYKYLKFRWSVQNHSILQGLDIPLHTDLMTTYRRIHYTKLFSKNAVFGNFPDESLDVFCRYLSRRILPANQYICSAGEVVTEFYIIEKGMCQLKYMNGFTTLREYDNIAIIEALKDVPIQFDVKTISDCILLCVNKSHFVQFLLFYPSIKDMLFRCLEGVSFVESNEISHIPRIILNEKIYSSAGYTIKRSMGLHTIQTIIAKTMIIVQDSEQQKVIRIQSNFKFYWELFRCVCIYINSLISLTNLFISNGRNPYIFTIFYIFDSISVVDIAIRFVTSYYNSDGIEITNYKCIIKHYLTHAFAVDVLGTIPFDLMIDGQIVYTRINRVILIYRLFGFAKYQEYKIKKVGFLLYLVIFFNFLLFIVFFSSITIYYQCKYKFHDRYRIPRDNIFDEGVTCKGWFLTSKYTNILKLRQIYYDSLLLITSSFYNMGFNKYYIIEWYNKVSLSSWSVAGYIALIIVTGKVIALSLFKNDRITKYQYGMKELVKYLSYRPIDKNLKNEVIKYFEYTWDKSSGTTTMDVISDFPLSLKLTILYQLYGPSMENRSIFSRASKSFIQQLLLISHQETYLKTALIYKVNDIQNTIFYLWKGLVEVVGPDSNRLVTLYPGSIFGCLDKCKYSRQTVSMIANGHVEILTFKNETFYTVLSKFPEFEKIYNRCIALYTDYIQSTNKRQLDNINLDSEQFDNKIYKHLKVFKPGKRLYYCEVALYIFDFVFATPYEVVTLAIGVRYYDMCLYYIRDILWIIRFYLKFHIAFENEYGKLVFDKKRIARKYINTSFGFYFDIVANIPLDIFSHFVYSSIGLQLFYVCRLNRFLRVFYLLYFLNMLSKKLNINSFVVRSIDILIQVIVLLQFESVLLYAIESEFTISNHRIKNLNKLLYCLNVISRLLTVNTIQAVLGNDTSIYLVICLFVNAVFMIWLLGRFLSTMQIVMQIKSDFNKAVAKFLGLLKIIDISAPEMNYINTYINCYNNMLNYPTLLNDAPYYLREAVLYSMFGYHLNNHSVLKKCHKDFLRQLAATMKSQTYYGNYILTIGDTDGRMYFIEEGTIHAISKDGLYIETVEHILGGGDHFGYQQLIYPNIGHHYTYKAESISVLVSIRRKDFLKLLEFFPATKKLIYEDNDYRCFL